MDQRPFFDSVNNTISFPTDTAAVYSYLVTITALGYTQNGTAYISNTIQVPDYCQPGYLDMSGFNTEYLVPLPTAGNWTIFGFNMSNACVEIEYTVSGNAFVYNIGDDIYFPAALDEQYLYNLTAVVSGDYGSFIVEIENNLIVVPPDCEDHNIMLMLGVGHDANQWEKGASPAEFDVSMVVGAEFPCTHVNYFLDGPDVITGVTIAPGSSLITFPALRQTTIADWILAKEAPYEVISVPAGRRSWLSRETQSPSRSSTRLAQTNGPTTTPSRLPPPVTLTPR